jgi:hypothetical protein
MRIATRPLLILLVHWITLCICLQGSQPYAWTTFHQSRISERLQCVGSRETLTRLFLESDDSGGTDNANANANAKDEATTLQQPSSPERQDDHKDARADPITPESPPPLSAAPVPVPVPTTSTTKRLVTSTESMTTKKFMDSIGTSPRRIFLSLASSTAIALGANFLGVTSKLLEAVPEATVEASGLDIFFPVGDYKRCRGKGYTFSYPTEWVADTTVELAKATRKAGSLDYSQGSSSSNSKSNSMLPDAAFGPPGNLNARGVSKGDTNVSVLSSPVAAGFTLRALGTPVKVANDFLMLSLAPKGSGRTATLVDAVEDGVGERQLYQFEYTVDRGERGPPLRAISVVCVIRGVGKTANSDPMAPPLMATATRTLLTLTVIAPQKDWKGVYETKLRRIASSFHQTAL